MSKHIVTNWENDLIEQPEYMVREFASDKYKEFELQMLSGLKHRAFEEVWETLNTSFSIIMQPSLLDKQQVQSLVSQIAHGIWVNFQGVTNNLTVRSFNFLSTNPFIDLMEIKEMCKGLLDTQGGNALAKIVKCVPCHFYSLTQTEHYEMCTESRYDFEIYARRHY